MRRARGAFPPSTMRTAAVRARRDFRMFAGMSGVRPNAASLRAEARLLLTAGLILLVLGFPTTLLLVARALGEDGAPPLLPLVIGAPPIMLGYLACHFASQRLVKARTLEERR